MSENTTTPCARGPCACVYLVVLGCITLCLSTLHLTFTAVNSGWNQVGGMCQTPSPILKRTGCGDQGQSVLWWRKSGSCQSQRNGVKFTIYCYNPTINEWCPHAILPVKFYGLGQLNQKIIAVGGCKVPNYVCIISLTSPQKFMKDSTGPIIEIKKPWTHSRYNKGRYLPTILSSDSSLIVIGGHGENSSDLSDMEIFDTLSKQWSLVESNLPFGVCNFSATPVGNS